MEATPALRRPAGARSGYRLSFRYKAGSINPYPVHDDRQLAGYGHLGPALTDVLGKRQPPASRAQWRPKRERAAALYAGDPRGGHALPPFTFLMRVLESTPLAARSEA